MRKGTAWLLILALLPTASAKEAERAPNFTLPDLEGTKHTLYSLKGRKAIALIFSGIECPRARAAEERLCDMAKAYGAWGVTFFAINSNWNEPVSKIAEHVRKSGFTIPVLKDAKGRVGKLYKVEIQPMAFLLDGDFRIRYRGAIDDHKLEEFVRTPYLRNAIDAVLEGKEVDPKVTRPDGCYVKLEGAPSTSGEITYARQVSRILNKNCVFCHRAGEVGPFPLTSYRQARAWSREIKDYVQTRFMPPWKPVTNVGEYTNERRLSKEEIATLVKWHDNGTPLGDPGELPEPPTFSKGWLLGTPDAVLKAEGGYVVPAEGADEYRSYVIQNPFDQDKWISAVEYRPGNGSVVHHIGAFLDPYGMSEKKDAEDPELGFASSGTSPGIPTTGLLGGWVPGQVPNRLPDGFARRLRKGERIVLHTHYHKTGRPEKDEGAQVALYFAKGPVKRRVRLFAMLNTGFVIPAGAERHAVTASRTLDRDMHVLDVWPHMHLLGREFSIMAHLPDGTRKDLIVIKDWDFNWQEIYQFRKPIALPRGTRLHMKAVYDNSLNNPYNPSNPPKPVSWGDETTDEMFAAGISYTVDGENLIASREPSGEVPGEVRALLKQVDQDGDGKLTVEEFVRVAGEGRREAIEQYFPQFDTNGDGELDAKELVRVAELVKNQ